MKPENMISICRARIENWTKRDCQICERTLNGELEWTVHLKSNGHKAKQKKLNKKVEKKKKIENMK